ncbi:SMP-30/gluconolactonase/LRE family protein [Acidothermaceae bacterium B102]|nr:SMP-30/gluconolactonase/LRE family protein [Acidothermaceae bacterium B102]
MSAVELEATQATPPWAFHGEGPMWDHTAGMLRWVDQLRGDVLSWRPGDEAPLRWHVGETSAAIRLRRSGGLAIAAARGWVLLTSDGEVVGSPVVVWDDPTVRMNEGACHPSGRFYCGSMDVDEGPGRGSMHVLEPDLTVRTLLTGISISNGMVFSDDGRSAFHIDSPTRQVTRYRVDDDGALVAPELLFAIPDGHGIPDGMTMDTDGTFWIAMWGGSAVRRYAPSGELLATVPLPVSQPTACAFHGSDLYITSSRLRLADDAEPLAGSVFRVATDATGREPEFFAG